PVVPEVRAGNTVVHELVAHRLPRPAAVVGALDQLPEPARTLRSVHPVGIRRRSLQMIHLPSPEMGTGDVPSVTPAVRLEHERALPRADQYPYTTHASLLPRRSSIGTRRDRHRSGGPSAVYRGLSLRAGHASTRAAADPGDRPPRDRRP